jgi:hypothetical protein
VSGEEPKLRMQTDIHEQNKSTPHQVVERIDKFRKKNDIYLHYLDIKKVKKGNGANKNATHV